ncbi:quinoprotein glucose dehydrogenase [Granulicella pectinivorans]|uniref:Quinoprotein glucose dehydrogenase n=1 Tax=Granulicella pectinivorans TaxID=474950 RepID=A0A1I6M3S7_9BACT|nr:pyrroloquinoline quinone-dependent dehydrogenase [Granulicella pectinivorans]SFS10331.1 quinoprotein glucose dehydrogenase [Granulicella pectinivorans]
MRRNNRILALAGLILTPILHAQSWPTYGGDPGGQRFSPATQITKSNLKDLQPAWTYHTHALDQNRPSNHEASFEATPILDGDTLYLTTPYDVVIALDAATGQPRWTHDPNLAPTAEGSIVASRGVALWHSAVQTRIFVATLDARLLALDATTGHPISTWGTHGEIDLKQGVHLQKDGFYRMTSPPTVIGDIVVVGSGVGDNQQVDSESGLVRAYSTLDGHLLWSWEPIPWASSQAIRTGAANTWSVISADPALNLLYLPTGSAAPDYYGGLRPGDDRDANSIVALDATTGKKVWAFQVVHHDLWDYDIASQPLLFTFRNTIPAVAITTKMGMVFVLDRRTGAPLYPIHERPVPQSDVPGETTSPTQPFQELPSLSPLNVSTTDIQTTWQRSSEDAASCQRQFAALRNEGLYTPPSLRGSVLFPGNLGGVNWGSAALDPATGILYANTNRSAFKARLVPRYGLERDLKELNLWLHDWANWGILAGIILALGTLINGFRHRRFLPGPLTLSVTTALMLACVPISRLPMPHEPDSLAHFGYELSPQHKTPYLIERDRILDTHHHPCSPTPWGAISALNLNTGQMAWQRPLGSMIDSADTGAINFGGPIVTASGLVFTAAAEDPYLRAFDAATGDLLWQHDLPVPAQSTPMTYTLNSRQYVVIAAGGHGDKATKLGDSLIAFALPNEPEATKPGAPQLASEMGKHRRNPIRRRQIRKV